MLELVYTAAPKGLISGRSGFVTVEMTEGFPPNLISPLENLSGYKALYPPEAPEAVNNPANFCYQLYGKGAGTVHIVSRISYAGLSYTGRSNNLAHHLLFTRAELEDVPGGPAALLACDRNFPAIPQAPRVLPPRRPCTHATSADTGSAWERLCGDARWAQVIAAQFRQDHARCVILQFIPGKHSAQEILQLVAEVTQFLTPQEAVDFTFSTYCYQSSIGNPIFLRAYPEGSPFLASIRRLNPRGVIVLGESTPLNEDELRLIAPPEKPQAPQELRIVDTLPPLQPDADSTAAPAAPAALSPQGALPRQRGSTQRHCAARRSHAPLEEAPRGSSHTLPVIIAVAVTLALMPVLYFVLMQCGIIGGKRTAPVTPIPSPEPVAVQQPAAPAEAADPVETPAPAPPQDPTPIAAPAPEEHLAAPAPLAPAGPTPQERLAFHKAFRKGERSIPLPSGLPADASLLIRVDAIGTLAMDKLDAELQKQCVKQKGSRHVVVYPINVITGNSMLGSATYELDKKSSADRLTLRIDGNLLKIDEPATPREYQPRRSNILAITIGNVTLYRRDFPEEFVPLLDAEHSITREYLLKSDGTFLCRIICSKELQDTRHLLLHVESPSGADKTLALDLPIQAVTEQKVVKVTHLASREELLKQVLAQGEALDRLNSALEGVYQDASIDFSALKAQEKLPGISNPSTFGEELEELFTKLKQVLRIVIDTDCPNELSNLLNDMGRYKKPAATADAKIRLLQNAKEKLATDDTKLEQFNAMKDAIASCESLLDLSLRINAKIALLTQDDSRSFAKENDALAKELQALVPREAYEKHFMECLDDRNPEALDLKRLQNELMRRFPVKVQLKKANHL